MARFLRWGEVWRARDIRVISPHLFASRLRHAPSVRLDVWRATCTAEPLGKDRIPTAFASYVVVGFGADFALRVEQARARGLALRSVIGKWAAVRMSWGIHGAAASMRMLLPSGSLPHAGLTLMALTAAAGGAAAMEWRVVPLPPGTVTVVALNIASLGTKPDLWRSRTAAAAGFGPSDAGDGLLDVFCYASLGDGVATQVLPSHAPTRLCQAAALRFSAAATVAVACDGEPFRLPGGATFECLPLAAVRALVGDAAAFNAARAIA